MFLGLCFEGTITTASANTFEISCPQFVAPISLKSLHKSFEVGNIVRFIICGIENASNIQYLVEKITVKTSLSELELEYFKLIFLQEDPKHTIPLETLEKLFEGKSSYPLPRLQTPLQDALQPIKDFFKVLEDGSGCKFQPKKVCQSIIL